MTLYNSKYFFIFLRIFIIFIMVDPNVFSQDFRIDTLRAYYTSGQPPAQIIGSVHLSFRIPAGKDAVLSMKRNPTGAYLPVNTFGDLSSTATQRISFDVPNLFVRDEIYCFRLELRGGSTQNTKELCSIPFFKEPELDATNHVVFQMASYQPGSNNPFETFRPVIIGKCISDFGCVTDTSTFATNTKLISPYRATKPMDSQVKCGEDKVYQITIDIDGMISISDTIQNKGFTKNIPSSLNESWAYATVENNRVKLVWRNDETVNDALTIEKKFILERRDGDNGTYNLVATPALVRTAGVAKTAWDFVDGTSDPTETKYSYRLKYEDYCGNLSPPIDIYPIFLEQSKENFELLWSDENNDKITDYELEYFVATTAPETKVFLVQPKGNSFRAETANYYRIKAKQAISGVYIYSNFIPNDENIKVLNPNVFTPDGKGPAESETFKVFGAAIDSFYMVIYDRTGLLVYFSDSYTLHRKNGWDGKLIYTDIDLPEGQYVFQVDVTNSNRRKFTKRGNVLLIRN
jgi:CHU_C Type IX secretion signal domain